MICNWCEAVSVPFIRMQAVIAEFTDFLNPWLLSLRWCRDGDRKQRQPWKGKCVARNCCRFCNIHAFVVKIRQYQMQSTSSSINTLLHSSIPLAILNPENIHRNAKTTFRTPLVHTSERYLALGCIVHSDKGFKDKYRQVFVDPDTAQ